MKKNAKKGKKKYCFIALLVLMLMPALSWAEWKATPFDFRATKGIGLEINGGATGMSASAVLGSLYSIDYLNEKAKQSRKMIELGTLDLGFGSRFGPNNAEEGSKFTVHIGPGICFYQVVCASYVYAIRAILDELDTEAKPWRPSFVFDIVELGKLVNLDEIPGFGEIFH